MARRRKPFATVEHRQAGWFAEARIGRNGMRSGPWDTEAEATAVADKWNAATS